MCTSSDSGSNGFWKDAALILGASMLLNRKQDNSSEDYGSCDNPVSMIIECFGMMKLLLIDPIIWAFGVVSEAPSLLGKIFYFFFLLLSAPAYYALAILFATAPISRPPAEPPFATVRARSASPQSCMAAVTSMKSSNVCFLLRLRPISYHARPISPPPRTCGTT